MRRLCNNVICDGPLTNAQETMCKYCFVSCMYVLQQTFTYKDWGEPRNSSVREAGLSAENFIGIWYFYNKGKFASSRPWAQKRY